MKLKEGVQALDVHPSVLHAMDVVDAFWRQTFGTHAVVTSLGDSNHSEGSLHYGVPGDVRTRAFDLRTRDLDGAQKAMVRYALRRLLGEAYDVILETTHLHIEFDINNVSSVARSV